MRKSLAFSLCNYQLIKREFLINSESELWNREPRDVELGVEMDSINSFKGYGKGDEAEAREFRRKTRRRLIILVVCAVVLVGLVVGVVAGTVIRKRNSSSSSTSTQSTPAAYIKTMCEMTEYPTSCIDSLEASNSTDPEALFKFSLQIAMTELSKLSHVPTQYITNDTMLNETLWLCQTIFEDAIDRLNDSISSMEVGEGEKLLTESKINDLKTWLSTTITYQETCLDGLQDLNSTLVDEIRTAMKNSTELVSNSLAIVTNILGLLADFNIPIHRRLLGFRGTDSDFPEWVSAGDRRLLQANNVTANVIVAKDGSGKYKTISDALKAVPRKSKTRFIIYVKAGTYDEIVRLDQNTWNVMMIGDGKTETIVTGSLNFVDGTPTFSTPTFAVVGNGFIARDMGFVNTAGPAKQQAVAFLSGSDLSVFSGCSFDAYQDTLYVHSNRQFYRDCDITGTVDFIFGNAAVVFQNCNIMPRQPLGYQFNTITAQGKTDPNQNTGISIQKCNLSTLLGIVLSAQTYLGRPWKAYSTTVIMQSNIGSFLNPLGWTPWVTNVQPPSTIYYAEYQNTGPGSSVAKRVKWSGYKPALTAAQAGKFTVNSFIQGNDWLPATNFEFDASL